MSVPSNLLVSSAFLLSVLARVASAEVDGQSVPASAPEQFAYGIELTSSDAELPIQTMLVPLDVYRKVTRNDLGDIRVFDAEGLELPFATRSLVRPSKPSRAIALPRFPVYAAPGAPLPSLSFRVEQSEAGERIEIVSLDPAEQASQNVAVRAYILDAAPAKNQMGQVRALRFAWLDTESNFVTPVNVERSSDLTSWTNVAYNTSLARLGFEGRTLKRDEIPVVLPGSTAFLRLTWSGGTAPPIASVSAVLRPETLEPERRSITVKTVQAEPHVFEFDLGGPIPVDCLRFSRLQSGTFAEVQLFSREAPSDAWQAQGGGVLYSVVTEGVLLESEAFNVDRRRHRYWRMTVDSRGGGLGSIPPSVEASWVPEQLLFVKRGLPPYLLAFGSAQVAPTRQDAARLLTVLPDEARKKLRDTTLLSGNQVTLGGLDALRPVPKELWKTYLLWGVLLGSVALLVTLSVRLALQLSREGKADV